MSLVLFFLWSQFLFSRFFLAPTCLWSELVAVPSLIFGPVLSSVWLWFSIRICVRSESVFRSGVSFGPNLSFVRFRFWSELVGGLYLVFGTTLSLIWICLSPILSLVQIWFSHRICVWSESCFRTEFFFSPIFSLVAICLLSEFFFGPNLSLVRICRKTKCDFRSGFVFGLTLVSDPNLSLFRIWFSVWSFVWSEFVFCALLIVVRTCRWSLSGFRYDFVFAPILSLVQIWFSLRICLWSDSSFLSEFVFGMNLSLFWIWFSVRICLSSESGFGPSLSLVRIFYWSQLVFGRNLSQDQGCFPVRICLQSDFGFRSEIVFVPNLFFGPEFRLVRICL